MQNRKRDIDVQNRLLDSVGEGEGGMFRENSIKTCILSNSLSLIDIISASFGSILISKGFPLEKHKVNIQE